MKKKTESLDAVVRQLEAVEALQAELFKKLEPLQNQAASIYKSIETLRARRDTFIIANAREAWEIGNLNWPWLLECNNDQSMPKYKFVEEVLHKMGLGSQGYYPKTQQIALRISLNKNAKDGEAKLNQVAESIRTVLPHMKLVEGAKEFSIFEHTLSENGCPHLQLKNNKWNITFTRYGRREHNRGPYKTLEEALKYIQENLWYEDEAKDA